jgi:methyl-accepting chemotaxis protein
VKIILKFFSDLLKLLGRFGKNLFGLSTGFSKSRLRFIISGTIPIRYKLVGFFLLVSLIPITMIGYVSYFSFTGTIRDKIKQYSLQGMWQTSENLKQRLNNYENISLQLINDREINRIITEMVASQVATVYLDRNQKLISYLQRFCSSDKNIKDIYFYSNDDRAGIDTGNQQKLLYTPEQLKRAPIYLAIMKAQGIVVWDTTISLNKKTKDFVVGRVIRDLETQESTGVLVAIINEAGLNQGINPYYQPGMTNDNYYMVVDENGKILIAPFAEHIGKNAFNIIKKSEMMQQALKVHSVSENDFIGKIGSQEVLVNFMAMQKRGWYLLNVAPTYVLFKEARDVGWMALFIALIFAALAILISWYFSGNISNPIKQIANVMKLAEGGDLTTRVKITSHDEFVYLGESFNHMLSQISQLIVDAKAVANLTKEQAASMEENAIQSAKTSETVALAMNEINSGTLDQTKEAEQASHKMSELADDIDAVVSKAAGVELITDTTKELSYKSKETITNLINTAKESTEITHTIIKDVEDLNTNANEIGNITDIIVDIAEKTNLLALNAAIEAARAGEAGRGFAVVAKEVNKLAAQSQHAAQAIEDLLQVIKSKTGSSAKNADRAHLIFREQAEAVQSAESAFGEIIKAMDEVITKMTEMSFLVQKVNSFKEQTLQSIINISAISEETAAAAEQVTVSSQEQTALANQVRISTGELRTIAENLVAMIDKFKVSVL